MRLLRNIWLHRIVGAVVGSVFVYACRDKILWPGSFAKIVYHYQIIGPNALFPPLVPNLFAVTLPWIEAFAGLSLIFGLWRREAAQLAGVMLFVFILAVGWTLYQGIDINNCGCFNLTAEGRRAGWMLIFQDLVLLAGTLLIALFAPEKRAPGHARGS
jgi:uncharacterized membrane protein YphA (DoxX/SURF4 family)